MDSRHGNVTLVSWGRSFTDCGQLVGQLEVISRECAQGKAVLKPVFLCEEIICLDHSCCIGHNHHAHNKENDGLPIK